MPPRGQAPVLLRPPCSTLRVPGAVPPPLLVMLGIGTTQAGAAIAKGLFPIVGPAGTVFLRALFAAIVLLLIWRPRLAGRRRHPRGGPLGVVLAYGLALAGMNLAFYSALDHIPLGLAVTIEFVGPLGVAVVGSRRRRDLLWAALAATGIAILTPLGGGAVDPGGLGLALVAGLLWAACILLAARTGTAFPGGGGLALALAAAAVALAPAGIAGAGVALLDPAVLLAGLGVALLSSALPYSFELEALRHLPAATFGVLLSLEPAVGALVGFVVLGEGLTPRHLAAVALVVAASTGAAGGARGTREG